MLETDLLREIERNPAVRHHQYTNKKEQKREFYNENKTRDCSFYSWIFFKLCGRFNKDIALSRS